jgi:hypothetical protein
VGEQPAAGAQPAPIERRGYQGAVRQGYRGNSANGTQQPSGQQSTETIQEGARPSNGVRGTEQLPSQGAPAPRVEQPQGQEELYNRAVPPPARPNFEQQRQAIQNTDPGRPLSPQQLDNLRENRPVGEQQVREPAPHPAPQQRSAPPQRSSPPPRSNSNGKH